MRHLWVINHYAVPPSMGTFVRQYYFAKAIRKWIKTDIFTSSKIHNTEENIIEKHKNIVTREYQKISFHFIRTRDYQSNGIDRIINMVQFAIKVLFIPSKKYSKPDVIYASSPDLLATFFSVILAIKYKAKIIVEVRDIWPWSIVEFSSRFTVRHIIIRMLSLIEKWIYKKADALIFTMEGGKDYLKDRHWDDQIVLDKVHYINNGVSFCDYHTELDCSCNKNGDGNKNTFRIVYAGSLRTANNIPALVEAMVLLPDNIRLEIYGDGGDFEKIAKMIANKQISNVTLMGKVKKSEIPRILCNAYATVLHYWVKEKSLLRKYGSSQNKLIEYLAAGKPVISNQMYGYDIVNTNNCGVSRNCFSPEEFANMILEFCKIDVNEYTLICQNCINTAKSFDWDVLAEKFENILISLIGR